MERKPVSASARMISRSRAEAIDVTIPNRRAHVDTARSADCAWKAGARWIGATRARHRRAVRGPGLRNRDTAARRAAAAELRARRSRRTRAAVELGHARWLWTAG